MQMWKILVILISIFVVLVGARLCTMMLHAHLAESRAKLYATAV
jgi:hypothetical protein